ncbi:MAG: hypothetical protein K1X55_12400, partial [Chitinophagales bacterium]|nr:hypothetical protein [Chitinophagales bacterium]
MVTTTNFKKWAGLLMITGIFLLSGMRTAHAQIIGGGSSGKDEITSLCVPFGTKTVTFSLPNISGCLSSPSWTIDKTGRDSIVIGDGVVTFYTFDTSAVYTLIGCCRGVENLLICDTINLKISYGFDPYDGGNYSFCDSDDDYTLDLSGVLCESPTYNLPSGFTRLSRTRILIAGSVTPGIYPIEICCGACCETFEVSITTAPDAGADQQICGIPNSFSLGAAQNGDTWSFVSGPSVATIDPNTGSVTFGTSLGTYCFALGTKGGTCQDTVCVDVCDPLNIDDITVCGNTASITLNTQVTLNLISGPNTPLYSSAGTTINFGLLEQGVYVFEAINDNCRICTDDFSITVSPIFTSGSLSNTTCGLNNGSININTVSGGTSAPYTFDWSHLAGTNDPQSVSGLAPGNYTLLITDAKGCSTSFDYDIAGSTSCCDNLSINIVKNTPDTVCVGTHVQWNITQTGATSGTVTTYFHINGIPGSYTWPYSSGHGFGFNQPASNYTIVIDSLVFSNGCTVIPPSNVLTAYPYLIDITSNTTNTTCGLNNGSIDLTVSGGTAPYTYLWNNGATTQDRTNLSSGSYSLTITDANGCSVNHSFVVNSSTALNLSTSVTPATCFGSSTGAVDLTVSGSTAPYTYLWGNGATTEDISNVLAGNQYVNVTSADGCTANTNVTVGEPNEISILGTTTNSYCKGGDGGSVETNFEFGVLPFTYSWSNGATTQNLSNVTEGSYTITVTDANGCKSSNTFRVDADNFNASVSVNRNCVIYGGAMQLSANVTPSASGSSFAWSGPDGFSASVQNPTVTVSAQPSNAGTYNLTVSKGSCTVNKSLTVCLREACNVSVSVISSQCINFGTPSTSDDVICLSIEVAGLLSGQSLDLSAWLDPNGNNSQPITTINSNGQHLLSCVNIVNTVSGYPNQDGFYFAYNLTGDTTCMGTIFVYAEPCSDCPSPLSLTATRHNTCGNGNGGSIDVTVSGGTAPFTYNWDNGATTQDLNNLSAGIYILQVSDANGCNGSISVQILSTPAVQGSGRITDASCGNNNGIIDVTISAGTAPYSYLWNDGSTTEDRTNLSQGSYSVTITDAVGCTLSLSFTVNSINGPVIDSVLVVNVSCNGENDGLISIVTVTGNPPYSYFISPNAGVPSGNSFIGLPPNTYTVTVTDVNGCSTSITKTITEPTSINISGSLTNVSCLGGSNGAIDISVSGGTSPYTYIWSNGATTADITGLTAGNYIVTVTDNNNCEKSALFTLTEPSSAVSTSTTKVDATCGSSNGSIDLSVSGGTSPYTYAWSNGATTQDISSLAAGTYTVTVTDANGCTASTSVTINNTNGPSLSTTKVDATCGNNNGSIDLSVSGGTSPFTYAWSNGATTQDISSLAAGTYTVTVTDANGCTASTSVTINNTNGPSLSTTKVDATCGSSNGSIDLSVSGGTSPYTYAWSNGATTQDISSLAAGTYTVTVTDANGCTASTSVTINNTNGPSLSTTKVDATCGSSNGSIDLSVSGGTSPFTYAWSNGATTQDISSLAAGTYTVTVTDANGCTASTSVTINNTNGPSLSTTKVDATCGSSNGSIDLSVSGGTSPFTYAWSNGATTQDISSLAAGTYTVTVTDANGCAASTSVTINNTNGPSLSTTKVDATCGSSNGSIDLSVSGGTSPFTYAWSNGATTQDISSLAAGTYTVTVTDAKGCTATTSVTINNTNGPTLSTTKVDATCGFSNGSIDLSVTGGTSPYTYSWSNGATTEDLSSLSSGNYIVTVTDAKGCSQNALVTINDVSNYSITASTPTNPLDEGDVLYLNSVSNPASPVSVVWSGPNGYSSTSENPTVSFHATPDMEGTYQVIGTYGTCKDTATVDVTIADKDCNLGVAIISAQCDNKGTPDPSDDEMCLTIVVTGLPAGDSVDIDVKLNSSGTLKYLLTRLGSNGTHVLPCIPIQSTVAGYPNQNGFVLWYMLQNSFTCLGDIWVFASPCSDNCIIGLSGDIISPSCGQNNGSINVSVNGGTAPYTYAWNNGATTQNISNLGVGNYLVTVTDANLCTRSILFTLVEDSCNNCEISALATHTDATCGNCNGTINLTVNGGTAPFTYLWNDGNTSKDRTGLCAGTYSVTVTDAKGCTASVSNIQILSTGGPSASLVSKTDETCNLDNGTIDISVSGGTAPYTYLWNDGVTTQDRTGLNTGTYSVTITDAKGCVTSLTGIIINNIGGPSGSVAKTNATCGQCNGTISLTVSGGTAPFTYLWNDGNTNKDRTGLCAGTYSVLITDDNGCTANITNIQIISNGGPTATLISKTDETCDQNNGTIDISVSSGTTPYTYLWNDGVTTQDRTGLNAGTYSVTITDANGCTTSITGTLINNISGPSASSSKTNATCGQCNGTITLSVSGGTAPYTYMWNDGNTSKDRTGLCAGTYSAVITDANGCTTSVTNIQITNIGGPTGTVVKTNVTCGLCNGTITLTVSGGTAPFTYLWNDGNTSKDRTNLCAGVYSVVITDANGCTGTVSNIQITNTNGPNATFTKTDETCDQNNGTIDVSVAGGTTPYTYLWNDGVTTQDRTSLNAGTYSVTITDANGCTTSITNIIINNIAGPSASFVKTNASCGKCDGVINVTVTGGTAPYTYVWNNGTTTEDRNNLCPGTYSVVITDDNGCVTTLTNIQITNTTNLTGVVTTVKNGCKGLDGNVCVTSADSLDIATISDGFLTLNLPLVSVSPYKYCLDVPIGTYYIRVKKGSCERTDTIKVINNNPVEPEVTLTFVDCNNTCVRIDVPLGTVITSLTGPSGAVNMGTITCLGNACFYERCNMPIGHYTGKVGISDGAGGYCEEDFEFDVTRSCACNAPINITYVDSISCIAGGTGIIALDATFTATGGVGPYSWTINGVSIVGGANGTLVLSPSNPIYVNYPGIVNICVTDGNGCEKCLSYTPKVFDINDIDFTLTKVPGCNESDGEGVITITYSPAQAGTCFTVLATGVINGPPFTPITYLNNVTVCDNDGDGIATVNVTGLTRSILNITVSNGECSTTETLINISSPVNYEVTKSCSGNDGAICLTPLAGGNLNGFDFVWYKFTGIPGQPGASYQIMTQYSGDGVAITGPNGVPCITGLSAGLYAVVITDPDGCKTSLCIEVKGGGFLLSPISVNNSECSTPTGALCMYVGNEPGATGINPYTIALKYQGAGGITNITGIAGIPSNQPGFMNGSSSTDPAFQNVIFNVDGNSICGENLPAGIYTFTVTSPSGCKKTISFIIDGGPDLTTTVTPGTSLCSAYYGLITVCADASYGNGGTNTGFSYTWNGNLPLIPNTLPYPECGGYFYNDFAQKCITIIRPKPSCIGGVDDIEFTVTARDNSSDSTCTSSEYVNISFYDSIPITVKNVTECVTGNGPFSTSVCATIGIDTSLIGNIIWTPLNGGTVSGGNGSRCAILSGTLPNFPYQFRIHVTDTLGCQGDAVVTVTFNQTPTIAATVIEAAKVCGGYGKVCINAPTKGCEILVDGVVTNVYTGGSCDYILVHAGTHTISVRCGDCKADAFVFVPDSSSGSIIANCFDIPTCKDSTNGSACASIEGGAGVNIRYDWTINKPGFPTQYLTTAYPDSCIENLPFGTTYKVVVRDENAVQISCDTTCETYISINLASLPNPAYMMGIMQSGYYIFNCPGNICPPLTISDCNGTLDEILNYLNSLGAGLFSGICQGNTMKIYPPIGVTCVYITSNPNVNTQTIPTPCGCFDQYTPPATGCYSPSNVCSYICDTTITSCIDSCTGMISMDTLTVVATAQNVNCGSTTGDIHVQIGQNDPAQKPFRIQIKNATTLAIVKDVMTNNTDTVFVAIATGNYIVTVTDAFGCSASDTVNLIPTGSLTTSYTTTDASCGQCNGTIDVTVSGGIAPYTYLWNDGATTQDRTGLCAGTYSVSITDVSGCSSSIINIVIGNVNGPSATAVVTSATCGKCNGAINVTVTGGTAPYDYLWNDGATTEDRTNLCAGTYSVLVTDDNGCTFNLTQIVVNSTAGPTASFTKTDE